MNYKTKKDKHVRLQTRRERGKKVKGIALLSKQSYPQQQLRFLSKAHFDVSFALILRFAQKPKRHYCPREG